MLKKNKMKTKKIMDEAPKTTGRDTMPQENQQEV